MEQRRGESSQVKYIDMKPYMLKELAAIYGVDKRTFLKWIKPYNEEIGQRIGHYYNINQVKIIFWKLSLPNTIKLLNN